MFDDAMKLLNPFFQILPTGERIKDVIRDISDGVEAMNYRFVGARTRVTEFSAAIGDAVPLVERLGGNASDVSRVIDSVAAATKRNVVASSEEVTKLFAAQKLTGTDAQTLVDKFQNVGIGFSQIGGQLESSIKYIQSVGGNARDIMQQVNGIVENINRFNFQDGVLGLTRMATQAQLLKFDMNATLGLAEKALNPEGAIELASAFQRMGVSVGDLTDPFQLMYKSLNDPEGLQDSLIQMTKQFTYFDEKANSFKINPQGMLMLRELGSQIGISSSELSKMALNAADLDAKLSQISPSFEFENEDDKQYIANIAKMGKGGEYEVTVKRDGKDQTITLQQATNEELKELVQRQKESTQDLTLEEIQKEQLDILRLLEGEFKSIRDSFITGVASTEILTKIIAGPEFRKEIIGEIEKFAKDKNLDVTPKQIREMVDTNFPKIQDFVEDFLPKSGEKLISIMKPPIEKLWQGFKEVIEPLTNKIQAAIDLIRTKMMPDGMPKPTKDLIVTNDGAFEPAREDVIAAFQKGGIITETMKEVTTNTIPQAIDLKPLTEIMSKSETITKKFEFGDIPPLRIVFEKSPDFNDKDMALLEFNLQKENISEKLAIILQDKMKSLQEKTS